MKVGIKQFHVEMELKNKGMELEVRNNNNDHLGDLIVGKANVEWCDGRTRAGNGVRKSWEELIAFFEQ